MENQDYEKAKQECWRMLWREFFYDESKTQPVDREDVFNFTFNRAYRLGMESAKKEMLTADVDSLSSNVDSLERKQAEPKFKDGDLCMRNGYVARVLGYLPGSKFPYTVHILQTNLKTVANESDLEPYTEAQADKDFDNIVKRGFQNHNRLHIAAMAMQGILNNENEIHRAEICSKATQTPQAVAEYAIACADALIAESEKGYQL